MPSACVSFSIFIKGQGHGCYTYNNSTKQRSKPLHWQIFLFIGWHHDGLLDQRTLIPFRIHNDSRGDCLLHIFRQKHHFMRRCDSVCRASQCQITTKRQPRMVACAIIYHIPECLFFRLPTINDFARDILLYQTYRTSGAIVKKEIISVSPVLGFIVHTQSQPKTLRLIR